METKMISNPFFGRSDGQVFPGQKFEKKEIVDYKIIDEFVKVGEGKNDFIVKKKVVVAKKTDRKDFINSFSGDVGILNILNKVVLTGQNVEKVVDSGKFYSKQKGLVDISKMPDNISDAFNAVDQGVKAFDKLPADLKKKRSFASLAESLSDDELKSYVEGIIASRKKKVEVKTDETK